MQVKIAIVPDASPPPEGSPEVRVGIKSFDASGMSMGEIDHLSAAEGDTTLALPEGGRVELTAESPPLVFDNEQKAALPGEWPTEEGPVEPAPPIEEGGVKTAPKTTGGGKVEVTKTTATITPPPAQTPKR